MLTPTLIKLPQLKDPRGSLSFLESQNHIPFDIRRVYYIYDVPAGESRGSHAHKNLCQLFIAMSGSFFVKLDDGLGNLYDFHLSNPSEGLYIPSGYWRELNRFSSGSACLVLASLPYDEGDYIRDYDVFKRYKSNG